MPKYTDYLTLRKTDTTPTGDSDFVDGNDLFDFDDDLNGNWDIIDTAYHTLDGSLATKQDELTEGANVFIDDNSVISASGKYPYSFNNGNVDSSGNADLISYSEADVTYKIGNTYPNLVGTKADGQQFEVDAIADDNVSTLADGNYIKYIGSNDTTDLLKNKITVAKVAPSTPSADDVWINNAVSPLSVKKYVSPNYTNNGVSISSDGIATWNGTTDYIDTGVKPDYTQPFKIYSRVSVTALTQAGRFFGFNGIHDYDNLFGTSKIDDNRYYLYVAIAGTNTGITERIFNLNEVIDILFEFDGTDKYKIYVKTQSDTEYTLIKTLTNSNTIPNTNNLVLGYVDFPKLWGTIDLKEFRVFVDDILFYQPNIDSQGWQNYDKIPLGKITVSSGAVTGVESYPYNIDYISNNIVKSYRSGNTGYQIYADGYCVQWGRVNGTNSGTVNLSYSYTDTGYNIQLTSRRENSDHNITAYVVGDRTVSSFSWFGTATYTAGVDWLTTGYVEMF